MLAHPKAEVGERGVKCKDGHFPPHYQSELEKKVSPEAANRAKDHLKQLTDELHREAKNAYANNVPESNAFATVSALYITDYQ